MTSHPLAPRLALQLRHCHWLNRDTAFLHKCALEKLLVHLLMRVFGDIILCRWIGDTAVAVASTITGYTSACGLYARIDDKL